MYTSYPGDISMNTSGMWVQLPWVYGTRRWMQHPRHGQLVENRPNPGFLYDIPMISWHPYDLSGNVHPKWWFSPGFQMISSFLVSFFPSFSTDFPRDFHSTTRLRRALGAPGSFGKARLSRSAGLRQELPGDFGFSWLNQLINHQW